MYVIINEIIFLKTIEPDVPNNNITSGASSSTLSSRNRICSHFEIAKSKNFQNILTKTAEVNMKESKLQKPQGQENSNNKATSKNKPSGNSLKEREKRRKQVFKPVLDNPYTQVNWPFVNPNTAADIRELLVNGLTPAGVYSKICKQAGDDANIKVPEKPEVLNQITVGFNATTSALESLAKHHKNSFPMGYIFVCKYDIPAKILVQHFPVLTYTASKGSNRSIKLVQLPKGSADILSKALNVTDTTILGVSINSDIFQTNSVLFNEIPDVIIPYLEGVDIYKKPVINYLSTSAPVGVKKQDQKQKDQKRKQSQIQKHDKQSEKQKKQEPKQNQGHKQDQKRKRPDPRSVDELKRQKL